MHMVGEVLEIDVQVPQLVVNILHGDDKRPGYLLHGVVLRLGLFGDVVKGLQHCPEHLRKSASDQRGGASNSLPAL